jgi:Na+/phosphate symporter
MIQNSLQLLEHLGEIEEQIQKIEKELKRFNIELDSERLLEILIKRVKVNTLKKS